MHFQFSDFCLMLYDAFGALHVRKGSGFDMHRIGNLIDALPSCPAMKLKAALTVALDMSDSGTSIFSGLMRVALEEAQIAGCRGEIPVGAAIASADGELIASAGNRTRQMKDPTAHAEILAIRLACEVKDSERLAGCSIYASLEPCPMCASAISAARIARLYYGASDPKSGGVENGPRIFSHSQCHHRPEVYGGIGESEAEALLTDFFSRIRNDEEYWKHGRT